MTDMDAESTLSSFGTYRIVFGMPARQRFDDLPFGN